VTANNIHLYSAYYGRKEQKTTEKKDKQQKGNAGGHICGLPDQMHKQYRKQS